MNNIPTIGQQLAQERFNRRANKVALLILTLIVIGEFTGVIGNL